MSEKASDITELTDKFLRCRDIGHTWRELQYDEWEEENVGKPAFGFLRVLRCSSCRTLRRELITTHGIVGARSYRYRDGYQLNNAPGDKASYREEILRRRGLL